MEEDETTRERQTTAERGTSSGRFTALATTEESVMEEARTVVTEDGMRMRWSLERTIYLLYGNIWTTEGLQPDHRGARDE